MKLDLFDRNGKDYSFNLGEPFNGGLQARIYRLEDGRCLKHYIYKYSDCDDETIRMIADMELSGFYKIHELFYNKKGEFSSYTMDYYEQISSLDILSMPIDYTIDSFRTLYNSIVRLSEVGIKAVDLNIDNVILNNNGVIVIDVDIYSKVLYILKNVLLEKNIGAVYSLFKKLYRRAIYQYYFDNNIDINYKIIDELFSPKSSVDEVCKKLVKYKYPMDYIKSERGK